MNPLYSLTRSVITCLNFIYNYSLYSLIFVFLLSVLQNQSNRPFIMTEIETLNRQRSTLLTKVKKIKGKIDRHDDEDDEGSLNEGSLEVMKNELITYERRKGEIDTLS